MEQWQAAASGNSFWTQFNNNEKIKHVLQHVSECPQMANISI